MAVQSCVVCGMGSDRTDWIRKVAIGTTVYVGCDSHSQADVQAAAQKAAAPAPPPAKPN